MNKLFLPHWRVDTKPSPLVSRQTEEHDSQPSVCCCHPDPHSNLQLRVGAWGLLAEPTPFPRLLSTAATLTTFQIQDGLQAEPNPLQDSYPLLPPWPPFKSKTVSWLNPRHFLVSYPLLPPWPPFKSKTVSWLNPPHFMTPIHCCHPDHLSNPRRFPGWTHAISSSPIHCCHPDHLSNPRRFPGWSHATSWLLSTAAVLTTFQIQDGLLAEANPLQDSYPLLPPWPPFKSKTVSWLKPTHFRTPIHCCHPDHLSNPRRSPGWSQPTSGLLSTAATLTTFQIQDGLLAEANPLQDSYPLLPSWPPFKSAVGSWAWVRSPGWTHPTFSSPLHCCQPWSPFKSEVPGWTHPTSCLLSTAATLTTFHICSWEWATSPGRSHPTSSSPLPICFSSPNQL